jgi:hypothetical protein
VGTDYLTLAKVYDNVTPEDQLAAFEAATEKVTNTMSGRQERRNRNPARPRGQAGQRIPSVGLGRFDLRTRLKGASRENLLGARSPPALTTPPSELPASAW